MISDKAIDINAIKSRFTDGRLHPSAYEDTSDRTLNPHGFKYQSRLSTDIKIKHKPLKQSAVLLALHDGQTAMSDDFAADGRTRILLTLRARHLNNHAGQVAFPGGRIDPIDKTADNAALRETFEETALPPDKARILGQLPRHTTSTGYIITPIVAHIQSFTPSINHNEVESIFFAPFSDLINPNSFPIMSHISQGFTRDFYEFTERFNQGRAQIWGATAMILFQLAKFINHADCKS